MTRRSLLTAWLGALLCAPLTAHAAYTPRYAHSSTLLTHGNVLVAGGINGAGAVLNTAELIQTARDGSAIDAGNMNFARSSHTATILPDGRVLVTGGWGGAATVYNSAELYDPVTNTWSNVANNMTHARFNHTATLLNDGRVLVCGGQRDTGAVPTINSSCNFFCTSNSQSGCAGAAFTFIAAPSLQQGRSIHTAVLLKDGKVWFGGGWNPAVTPTYLATTERFDPVLGIFNSAAPLAQGRAYHTATLMGQGKILIAGGHNADNSTVNGASFGILRTSEIYDPVANSIIPGPSLGTRRQMHSATLTAENVVLLEGGLGNITTTYLTSDINGVAFEDNSVITHTFGAGNAISTTTVTGGTASLGIDFYLSNGQMAGVIEDGEIWLSSPQVHIPGIAHTYFPAASESNPGVGLRINLAGTRVGCDEQNNCGYVSGVYQFSNLSGQTFFEDIGGASHVGPLAAELTGTTLSFDQTLGSDFSNNATITGGSLVTTIIVDMPLQTVGATITSGTFHIVAPAGGVTFVKESSFTATITGGWATFSGQTVTLNGDGTGGLMTLPLTITNLTGQLDAETDAVSVTSPQSVANLSLTSITGRLRYVASQINYSNVAFQVDIATVVIRRMVFSSPEYYDPQVNQWASVRPGRDVENFSITGRARFGGTSTLLTNNDVLTVGGRECDDASPTCANFAPKGTGAFSDDYIEYSGFKNWNSISEEMDSARVFHTATNLPDGTILVAGGSNGPNVLRSAEIFNPGDETARPTNAPMHDVRDLHTATLLPNGRVLIAGGFTTNATSTGSTNTSEIYYPDTGVFLRAGVMVSSRSNHVATILPDGNVFVAGGFGANDVITDTAEIFYSTAMAWRQTTTMLAPRALNTATTLKDGRIMLAGGINANGVLSSVHAFDPTTGSWGALASMPSALHSHTATLLFDGRVLVAGGNNGLGEVDASYIYDPSGNSWSTTPQVAERGGILQQPRFGHNAVGLPNGDVVISGGSQRFGVLTEMIEYFHVTGNVWISSGITFGSQVDSVRPRSYHTMTLGSNNRLYAIGGSDGVIGGQGTDFYTTVERAYFTADPDSHLPNPPDPFQSPRQSSITATSATPLLPNTLFTVTGSQFRGGTEASGGGGASAHSSFSFPRLVLQAIEGSGGPGSQSNSGFVVDLTSQIYVNAGNLDTLNSSVTVLMPATNRGIPYGWYHARVGSNDIYSNPKAIQVGPAKPAAAPASVASTPLGSSSMSWTWGAVAGVDGYNVYQATTGVLISTTATASFIQTGLAPNTTASILVAGYTLTGDGPLAAGATNFTLTSTATSVTIASVTFTDLLLYWNPNGNEPGTVWEVSQSTDNFVNSYSTPVPNILGLTDSETTISNLLPNTTYYFRVRAFNGAGIVGGFSAVVSTLTRVSLASVSGTPTSPTSIAWSWSAPGGVNNYRVYNATTGVLIATLPGTAVGYADTGLAVNSRRSILVSAITAAGEGPLTPSSTHFTLANPPLAGSPHISAISIGSFTVNWTINNNPAYTEYRTVLYDTSGSTTPLVDETVPGPVISRTFGGLLPGSLYISSIAAVNGDELDSTWLVGSTYTLAQPARNLTVLETTPVSITVSWDAQQNGPNVQYELTYSTDQFVTHFATAIPFSSAFTGTSTTILGLQTSTTYWLRVQARTPFGTVTAFEPPLPTLSTVTFNGGAPAGALAGLISSLSPSQIFGFLGNGREIEVRTAAGTFPSDLTMTISSYPVGGGLCPNGVNVAVEITNAPALQPLKPVFLTMSYAPAEVGAIPVNRLVLFRYEPISGTCVPLETTATSNRVRAQINHFSIFQLGQVTLATDAGTARVFPNPYRAATDSYVTIDRVPAASRVRIFTLRGELVADMVANSSGIATWAASNGSGRSVASGLYLVMVEHGSSKKVLKLSVIR
ncbi:MAG: kelch repeat-containing protein [Elusimicrobiota bacterium]|nr:kelch repeat-containing protein [Elusimicrobiota bacterium]